MHAFHGRSALQGIGTDSPADLVEKEWEGRGCRGYIGGCNPSKDLMGARQVAGNLVDRNRVAAATIATCNSFDARQVVLLEIAGYLTASG